MSGHTSAPTTSEVAMPAQEYQKTSAQTGDSPQGEDGTGGAQPSSTAGNSPTDASPEARAANTTEAAEAQKLQADQEINRDPTIPDDDPAQRTSGTAEQDYSDLNLEELREELSRRGLSKSGNKPDLITRLQEHDRSGGGNGAQSGGSDQNLGARTTDAEPAAPSPRGEVDSGVVENGGIEKTDFGQQHAEVLQGLSAERRQQQLDAAKAQQQG